jgi:hypothetical protein
MKMNRIAAWCLAVFATGSLFAQDKPDLTGKVVNEVGGPIADASVFIYTAGPRVGPGYI